MAVLECARVLVEIASAPSVIQARRSVEYVAVATATGR
jgi:hypothetical protein